jgi:hypothetical protein
MPPEAPSAYDELLRRYGMDQPSSSAPSAGPGPADHSSLEAQNGLPPGLLDAVAQQESGGNPNAVSKAGAVGKFQFMPATARAYGLRVDAGADERRDPVKSAAAAALLLGDLHRRFSGRTDLALAAYNAGPGAVKDAGNAVPDFPETQNYVRSIMGKMGASAAPADTGAMDELMRRYGLSGDQDMPAPAAPDTTGAPAPPPSAAPAAPAPQIPGTGGYQFPAAGMVAQGPGGDIAFPPSARAPQGEVQVPPKSATDAEERQRQLADWWEGGGKAMSPQQIAALGPEYQAFYEETTGKRPTMGAPPSEFQMTGAQLAQSTGEQAYAGFAGAVAPYVPNIPGADVVKWQREVGASGPIGVAAGAAGAIAGYSTPTPLPVAARTVGKLASEMLIGRGAIEMADKAKQALFEDSLDALLNGEHGPKVVRAAQAARAAAMDAGASVEDAATAGTNAAHDYITANVAPTAQRFADAMGDQLLKGMSGSARVWAARNLLDPAAAGLTAGGIESATGLATGEVKPEDLPDHLVGTSLGFLVAHLGWKGVSAAMRNLGLTEGDVIWKARNGKELSDDEKDMLNRLVQRVRAGSQGPGRSEYPQAAIAGTPPQAPGGPVAPGEALERSGQAQALADILQPARDARAAEASDAAARAARAADKQAREASVAAARAQDVSGAMAPLQERAKFYVEQGLLSAEEVQSMGSPDALSRLLDVAQNRRAEEEQRKLATLAQGARLSGTGLVTRIPATEPQAAPVAPQPEPPPPAPAPPESVPERYIPGQRDRFWVQSILARAPNVNEAVKMAQERIGAQPGLDDYVRARWNDKFQAGQKEQATRDLIRQANQSEQARLQRGENRAKVARDIADRLASDQKIKEKQQLANAGREVPTEIGHAQDVSAFHDLLGPETPPAATPAPAPTEPTVAAPSPAASTGQEPANAAPVAPSTGSINAGKKSLTPKRTKEQQSYVDALGDAIGHWGKMLIDHVGAVRIDTQKAIAKTGPRDTTTFDLHPDTIKVLNDTRLGMVKGLIVNSDGVPIDEAADAMARLGFAGGDRAHAKKELLGLIQKIAGDASAGRYSDVKDRMKWGKAMEDVGGAMIQPVAGGDLKVGQEFTTHDGTNWTVTSTKPGAITVESTTGGKKVKVDEFDKIPTIGGVSGPSSFGEQRGAYVAGGKTIQALQARSYLVREPAGADWKTASDKLKGVLIRIGAYHMRRGAVDLAGLEKAMVGELGPRAQAFVPGVFGVLSKMPAFAKPAAQAAGAPAVSVSSPGGAGSTVAAPSPPAVTGAPAAKPGGTDVGTQPVRPVAGVGRPGGAEAGQGVHAPGPGGRTSPRGDVAAPPAETPPAKAPKAAKPEEVAPTRTLRPGGVATISKELLPRLEPEWKSLYDRLAAPEGLDKMAKMFGMRPLEHQVENLVRILRSLKADRAPVLADGTGTGKTLSAVMVINEHLLANPHSRQLVVLPNAEIKRQWEKTLKRAGINSHYVEEAFSTKPMTVNFMTYHRLGIWGREKRIGLIEGFNPDLITFDEAHRLRNFFTGDTAWARIGEEISRAPYSKKALFLSATPFQSFLHTKYLTRTQLWDPKQAWPDWLYQNFGIYKDKDGSWNGASPKSLRKIHESMYRSGVLLKHEVDFKGLKNSKGETITYASENRMVSGSQEHVAQQAKYTNLFQTVIAGLMEDPAKNRRNIMIVKGVQHLFNRSMDEIEKVRGVIDTARADLAAGKSVIFMLLRKNETSAEQWYADWEAGKREYKKGSYMPDLLKVMRDHEVSVPSPMETLRTAFPQATFITGDQPSGGGARASSIDEFQSGRAKVAVVTMAAGAEGLDLQDRIGAHPRSMYVLSVPYTAGETAQVAGRPFRLGSESSASVTWLYTDSAQDVRQAKLVANRIREMGALIKGEVESPGADEIEKFNFPELDQQRMKQVDSTVGPNHVPVTLEDMQYLDMEPDGDFNVGENRQRYKTTAGEQGTLFQTPQQVRYASESAKRAGAILSQDSALWNRLKATGETLPIYGATLESPADVAKMFQFLEDRGQENVYLLLTKGDTPIGVVHHAIGGKSHATVIPPILLAQVKASGADGLHLVHNHPSQDPTLSDDDVRLAENLAGLLREIGVTVRSAIATDIDRFGYVNTGNGEFRKQILHRGEMGSPVGQVAMMALHTERARPEKGDYLSNPPKAVMAWHAIVTDRASPKTAFLLLNKDRRVTGHVLVAGDFKELIESPDNRETIAALSNFLAAAAHNEVAVVSNSIAGRRWSAEEARAGASDTLRAYGELARSYLGNRSDMLDFIHVLKNEAGDVAAFSYRGDMAVEKAKAKKFEVSENKPGRGLGGLPARSEIVKQAEEILGTAIRYKRMGKTPKAVRGFYQPVGGNIRIRRPLQMDTIFHELGHRLDHLVFGQQGPNLGSVQALRRFRAELLPLATIPGPGQDALPEAFAEFMKHYVMDPAKAARVAPTFYPYFETFMQSAKDTKVLHEGILALRDLMGEWRTGDKWDRMGSSIVSGEMPFHHFQHEATWRHLYSYTFDQLHFLRWAQGKIEALADGAPLRPDQNLKVLATTITGRMGIAEVMVNHGMTTFGNPERRVGPSLREIAESVGSKWPKYESYVKALRTLYLMNRDKMGAKEFIGDYVTDDDVRGIVRDGKADFLHTYGLQKQYSTGLLRYYFGAGMLTEKGIADIEAHNLVYSPFQRLMDPEELSRPGGGAGTGGRMASLYRGLYKLTGSQRETFPALESLLRMTHTMVDRAEKNAVVVALLDQSKNLKDAGVHLAEWVPEEKVPIELRVGTIASRLRQELGIKIPGLTQDQMDEYLTLFMPSTSLPKPPYVWAWKNGVRRYAWINPDVYDALMSLERDQLPWFLSWMKAGPTLVRGGAVVLNPGFWGWNEARKLATVIVQSHQPWKNLMYVPTSFIDGLLKTERYHKYMVTGAAYATFVRQTQDGVAEAVRRMVAARAHPVAFYSNPVNAIRGIYSLAGRVLAASDMAPRIAEARVLGLDQAQGRADLLPIGAAAADVTLDYRRVGSKLKTLSGVTAFLTAHMQAIDRPVRFAKDHPARAAGVAVAAFLLGITYYMMNREKKQYQDEAQENKDLYWYFYPSDEADDAGFRLPKPYAYGWFATAAERTMESMEKHQPEMFRQFAEDFGRGMTPNFVPTMLQPPLEVLMNRSLNTGRKVQPDTGLPQERRWPWTTESAVDIARAISSEGAGVSGPVIEHLAGGLTGGLGMDALRLSDKYILGVQPKRPSYLADEPVIGRFFSRQPNFSTDAVRRFYEAWGPASDAYASQSQARAEGTQAVMDFEKAYGHTGGHLLQRYFEMQGAHAALAAAWKELDHLDQENLSDEQRKDREAAIARRITWAANMGLAAIRKAPQ